MFFKKLLKFIDKPFKLGGNDPDGYDCLGVVGRVQEELGKKFPHSFQDWDEFNYAELYTKDRPAAEEKMIEFFDSFAKKIPETSVTSGDIILVKNMKRGTRFPGVYIGNGNYITSYTNAGVRIFATGENYVIVNAWRIE